MISGRMFVNHFPTPTMMSLRAFVNCLSPTAAAALQSPKRANSMNLFSTMATTSQRTSHLEVERKFQPNSQLAAYLSDEAMASRLKDSLNTGKREGLELSPFPDTFIRDTYYDIDEKLTKKNIWIRNRTSRIIWRYASNDFPLSESVSTKWQAKISLGGDYTNSRFHEVEGEDVVNELVKLHSGKASVSDLEVLADLQTYRKTWVVQKPLSWMSGVLCSGSTRCALLVALDEVTVPLDAAASSMHGFMHRVGEVEMTCEVEKRPDGEKNEEVQQKVAESMDVAIEEFMEHYPDLFSSESKPLGKLSAYFAWRNETGGGNS